MQRFALLGAGFIGSVHAANLAAHPDVDFALVYDPDHERAAALASTYGTKATTDIGAAFDRNAIDAVFVASSTDTHAKNLRRATEVVRYATERSARAMVDFNRRFDRDYTELKRVVDSGEIGEVELIQMSTRGPAMPPLDYIAVSGGQMRDQTIHFFDLARWIAGLDPTEVYATGSTLAEPRLADYGDVDTSAVTLRLPTGALVQIDSARRTGYGYDERIEVLGSTGMAQARRHRTGAVSRYHAGRVIDDGLHTGWFERVKPTYAAALDHFVTTLEHGDAITPSLDDGLKAQAIAEAATRSLTSGKSEAITY